MANPTELFSGPLGVVRTVDILPHAGGPRSSGTPTTWPLDIPTIVLGGLLEGLQTAFTRLEATQNEILLELKKHTDALAESVDRPLEPIEM